MDIDATNRGILYMLQQDARRLASAEIAEAVDVSASTVRNRIERLEDEGIIRGYHPIVDYDEAGLQLHTHSGYRVTVLGCGAIRIEPA